MRSRATRSSKLTWREVSRQFLAEMKLPAPEGLEPDPEIEWTDPYLIFMAEHGRIAPNQKREEYGLGLLKRFVEEEFYRRQVMIEMSIYARDLYDYRIEYRELPRLQTTPADRTAYVENRPGTGSGGSAPEDQLPGRPTGP